MQLLSDKAFVLNRLIASDAPVQELMARSGDEIGMKSNMAGKS
jgi:hypothetical protein